MALTLSCAWPQAEEPADPPRRPIAELARGVPQVGILGGRSAVPRTSRVPFDHCSDTEQGFAEWLIAFREQAIAQGMSRSLAEAALGDVVYDPVVIELDRTQRPRHVAAAEFAASHVTAARVRRGRQLLGTYASLFTRIEARFGVEPEILVALWGLETDFGAAQGKTRSLDALATLAYDCRRATRFRGELTSALHLVERGDLTPREMVGAWAGELGQTQFLPSSYERFGVDFDDDGKVNLIGSVDDALASTASYLAGNGWRAHEGLRPRQRQPRRARELERVGGIPERGGALRAAASERVTDMFIVFGDKGSGAFAAEAALAEAGAPYELRLVSLEKNEQRSPEFLALNPTGKMPALQLPSGEILTESLAIMLVIAERYPDASLLPPAGSDERARAYRWLSFMATEIYPMVEISDYAERFTGKGDQSSALRATVRERIRERVLTVEREAAAPWFLASGFSMVDIYAAMFSRWRGSLGAEWSGGGRIAKLDAIAKAISERPRLAEVWKKHFWKD